MATMEKTKMKQKKKTRYKTQDELSTKTEIENTKITLDETSQNNKEIIPNTTESDDVVTVADGDVRNFFPSDAVVETNLHESIESDTAINKESTSDENVIVENTCLNGQQVIDECINQEVAVIKPTDLLTKVAESIPKEEIKNMIDVRKQEQSYTELATVVQKMKDVEMTSSAMKYRKVIPFTFEEIEILYGCKEIVASRQYVSDFEKNEMQAPASTHPLYDALIEYQRARSTLVLNQKDVAALAIECNDVRASIWQIDNCVEKNGALCADGYHMSGSYSYQNAILQKSVLSEFKKKLSVLREKATETHSLHSHAEHLIQLQVDELIWMSTVSGCKSIKESLRIMFWVLRTSGWGFDRALRNQLRTWCGSLAEALIIKEDNLQNTLFLLHHILRVSQSIAWAVHFVQCHIKNATDIPKALCLLEAILTRTRPIQNNDTGKSNQRRTSESNDEDNDEIAVASEAIDDGLWIVVDSEGEGADMETIGAAGAGVLRENDIISLIRQIPFENIFKVLMVVRSDNSEDIFCGGSLTGGAVLRVFATTRILLNIIRSGLFAYKSYQELTKELCRLTLHSIMYCTDLWEAACSNCEASLVERLSIEYDSVFLAGWSTLETAGTKEISTMFLADMPFKLLSSDTIGNLYKKVINGLIVSDSVWCYYCLVCISNMAIANSEEEFITTAIKQLFKFGFASDFSEFGCGEWARTLCGVTLRSVPHLTGVILSDAPSSSNGHWISSLPLHLWKPPVDEVIGLLNNWKERCVDLMPYLLKSMDWRCTSGIDMHTQRSVAIFLALLAQHLTRPKTPPPDWIKDCLLLLKLHCYDWSANLQSVPHPDSIRELDTSGKCHESNLAIVLTTSWGHSVPLVFQQAAPLLLKMVNAGRYPETVHSLYYLVAVLSESPDTITQCKVFREVLGVMLRVEKSYTKMATRLVSGDFSGPIKLLMEMMQAQLKSYSSFSLRSPRKLLMVWIYWLTCAENWQSDRVAIHLLETVLATCFLHHDAMSEAANIFGSFIQLPTSPKSPTSSSGFGSWLWNSNSSFKGLVQCNVEAPFLWHVTLWIEHANVERSTGLWQRLLQKLSMHKEGSKVNIDKTLKSVGGGDNSGVLVLYRSVQNAISMSITHPIYTLIWQLFFYIYLDISCLVGFVGQPKPIGPLFFQGIVNSRLLGRARARLLEARSHHEEKVASLSEKGTNSPEIEQQKMYHSQQAELMAAFHSWLEDDYFDNVSNGRIYSQQFAQKLHMLMTGQNVTWAETIDTFELNKSQPSAWPAAILPDGAHSNDRRTLSRQNSRGKSPDISPSERIILRLKTYERPTVQYKDGRGKRVIGPLLDPTIVRDFNRVLQMMVMHLKELEKCAKKYDHMCRNISSIDGNVCDMIPELYMKRDFSKQIVKGCGPKCTGAANFTLRGVESKIKDQINVNIGYNRKNHSAALDSATKPYDTLAKHTAVVCKLSQLACSGAISNLNDGGITIFNMVLNSLKDEMVQFPPANEVLTDIATQLGEAFVTTNGTYCVNLVTRMTSSGTAGLVGALLRPSQLSTKDMLEVYAAICSTVADMHVAFSYLSKFHISAWLRDTRPNILERNKFIIQLCDAIGSAGCDLPPERTILHELMCVHLSRVLAWEFPVHLSLVLPTFCTLSLEKKLPPDSWQHCITVIETYPHLLSHQQQLQTGNLGLQALDVLHGKQLSIKSVMERLPQFPSGETPMFTCVSRWLWILLVAKMKEQRLGQMLTRSVSQEEEKNACDSLELVGRQWWGRRGAWGPHGLPARYGAYTPHMARLGALLSSVVLSTAMLRQPPLLTHQITAVVFNAMRSFWDVWLVPWWGSGEAAAWVSDFARGPALMPWGPEEHSTADTMLDAFVETLLYCVETLPGSTNDLLGLTWQWYVSNYVNAAVAPHVLTRVHRALARLPWTAQPVHWLTFNDLQSVSKVSNLNLPSCHKFTLHCLAGRKWQPWLNSIPHPLRPPALHLILPLLIKLHPDQSVLDDAMLLPWGLLKVELFEEIVNWFMATLNSSSEPFHSSKLVPLLCASGGLVPESESNTEWQAKRSCLVRGWVNAISSFSQGRDNAEKKNGLNEAIALSIGELLARIENTVATLVGVTDTQQAMECSFLLNNAIQMLNMTFLLDITQQEWLKWINTTSKLCVTSLIGCLLQVTQRDSFAALAEQALLAFFKHKGDWYFIQHTWKRNCLIPVEYLLANSSLLTAMGTYKAIDRDKYQEQGNVFQQVDRNVLQSLHGLEISCESESQASVWVCYMISLLCDNTIEGFDRTFAANQIAAILEKWSQEPSWGLFKAMGLVQNKAASVKFRIITRFALCITLESLPSTVSSDNAAYSKTLSALEAMAEQKPCANVKHVIVKYLDALKNRSCTIVEHLRSVTNLCSELYCDVGYLVGIHEVFKT